MQKMFQQNNKAWVCNKLKLKKGTFGVFPALQCKGLDPYLQLIFIWLCYHADKDGKCFPSLTTLSKETGIDRRTIIRKLKELERLGFITKNIRYSDSKFLSNIYDIHILSGDTETLHNDAPSDCETLGWCQGDTRGSDTESLGVVTQSHPNKTSINQTQLELNKLTKPKVEKGNSILLQKWFDEKFWINYPLKKARKKAWEVIQKLNPDEDLRFKIENAISLQATERELKLKYELLVPEHPLAATWINGERWEDEVCINEEEITENAGKQINADAAYELALKEQYDNPAIYYARQSIVDWNLITNEITKKSRFKGAYAVASQKIESGEIDLLEYDILIKERYINPFGTKTGDYTVYPDFDSNVIINCNQSITNSKGKILIVEDDKISRQVLKYFLYEMHYETCSAVDICNAMRLYADVDMILLDIGLPKIDGLEFCKRVRAGKINKDVPIIGVTALKSNDLEGKGKKAGLTDLYKKPLVEKQIKEILGKYLTNS